jgi:hypothetical protein
MMNHEVTKSLVRERQHELTNSAVVGRLARRARRSRRHADQDAEQLLATIDLPPPKAVGATTHPVAA